MSEVTVVILALTLATGDARPVAIAAASTAYLFPGVVTGLLVGHRLSRLTAKSLLLIDNSWRGLWLAMIAVFAVTDRLDVIWYVVMLGLASLTRPLGGAGSRAIIVDLVEQHSWFAANSLVGFIVQMATMLGPAVGGVLIAVSAPGWVLALDAFSFLLFCVYLLTLRSEVRPDPPEAAQRPRAGRPWGWIKNYPAVSGTILLTGVFHALYGPFVVGLPILIAKQVDTWSQSTALGIFWSAFGVGAVLGALWAGSRPRLARVETAAVIVAVWGVTTMIVAYSGNSFFGVAGMFIGGLAYGPYAAIVTTIMQNLLPETLLKQASAYYTSVTVSLGALGILLGGVLVATAGAIPTLGWTGFVLICVGALSVLLLRRSVAVDRAQGVARGSFS